MLAYDIIEKIAVCMDKPGILLVACRAYVGLLSGVRQTTRWLKRHHRHICLWAHPKYLALSCTEKLRFVGKADAALWHAIQARDETMVRFLLDKIESLPHYALEASVHVGNVNIVRLLLDHNPSASIDIAMHLATLSDNIDVFKLLVSRGGHVIVVNIKEYPGEDACITCTIMYGRTCVTQTFGNNQHVTFRTIVEVEGSLNEWHVVAVFRRETRAMRYLFDAGADVHFNNEDALRLAVSIGRADIAKILIDEYGACVLPEFLATACACKNYELVQLLVAHRPAPKTLLMDYIVLGDLQMVKLLFDKMHLDDCVMEAIFVNNGPCLEYFMSQGGKIPILVLLGCALYGDWNIFKLVFAHGIRRSLTFL